MTLSITVPWDVARTGGNALRRLHWREEARRKKAAHLAARVALCKAGYPRLPLPAVLDVTIRRARRLDDDNAWIGLKPCRDALFADDRRVRCGRLRWEIGKQWKGAEEVLIEIRADEED